MQSLRRKIGEKDVLCFLLFFSIVKAHFVPQIVQQLVKISFVAIMIVFLICNNKKRVWNNGAVLGVILLLPSIIGLIKRDLELKTFLDGLLNSSILYVTYTFLLYMYKQGKIKRLLNDLYYLCGFACFVSLLSILAQGRSEYATGTFYEYAFGNKYASLYLFMLLVGLAYYKFYDIKRKKPGSLVSIICLIVIEMLLSYWVRCSTTLIGGAVMLGAITISGRQMKWIRKLISTPVFAVAYFFIPGFFAMNMVAIMRIPSVNHFVTGYLGKSVGLTGRVYIYSMFSDVFRQNPIIGLGYNSDIVNKLTGVGNAQNGLYQLLLEFGIIGVVLLSLFVYTSFKESVGAGNLWGIKVFVFAMCVCSVVEVSYNYLFFLSLFILRYSNVGVWERFPKIDALNAIQIK